MATEVELTSITMNLLDQNPHSRSILPAEQCTYDAGGFTLSFAPY